MLKVFRKLNLLNVYRQVKNKINRNPTHFNAQVFLVKFISTINIHISFKIKKEQKKKYVVIVLTQTRKHE